MKRGVVPTEPTAAMRKVCTFEEAEITWPNMLAAAPPYEPSEVEVEAAASAMGWSQYTGSGWEGFKSVEDHWSGIPTETRNEYLRAARAALIAADKARREGK